VSFNWIRDSSGDGHYLSNQNGSIVVSHIFTGVTTVLVNKTQAPKDVAGYVPNVDKSKLLFSNGTRKGYRYSRNSNYYVQDTKSGRLEALVPGQNSDITLATWSPK
jgi:Dipeptidyl peptidase IV (DPP IV) N-terminal region